MATDILEPDHQPASVDQSSVNEQSLVDPAVSINAESSDDGTQLLTDTDALVTPEIVASESTPLFDAIAASTTTSDMSSPTRTVPTPPSSHQLFAAARVQLMGGNTDPELTQRLRSMLDRDVAHTPEKDPVAETLSMLGEQLSALSELPGQLTARLNTVLDTVAAHSSSEIVQAVRDVLAELTDGVDANQVATQVVGMLIEHQRTNPPAPPEGVLEAVYELNQSLRSLGSQIDEVAVTTHRLEQASSTASQDNATAVTDALGLWTNVVSKTVGKELGAVTVESVREAVAGLAEAMPAPVLDTTVVTDIVNRVAENVQENVTVSFSNALAAAGTAIRAELDARDAALRAQMEASAASTVESLITHLDAALVVVAQTLVGARRSTGS